MHSRVADLPPPAPKIEMELTITRPGKEKLPKATKPDIPRKVTSCS